MQSRGRCFTNIKCVTRIIKNSKINLLPIGGNLSNPFSSIWVHALKPGSIIRAFTGILPILRRRRYSQIDSSIVERIVIRMIRLLLVSRIKAEDESAHVYRGTSTAQSIESFIHWRISGAPLPLIQPLVISGIHNRKLSLSEWNQTIRYCRAGFLFTQVHGVPLQRHRNPPIIKQPRYV